MVAVSTLSLNGADLGRKAKMVPRFVNNVSFGTKDFDIPTIAIALLIVGLIVGLSTLILTIFAGATANTVQYTTRNVIIQPVAPASVRNATVLRFLPDAVCALRRFWNSAHRGRYDFDNTREVQN